MLTIKPVGSMKSFFDDDEYTIDVKSCIDVILYIQAMHPRLGLFMRQAQCLATIEDFCFLTEDGETIEPQYFPYHKFKEDDVLYIAPLIAGAGGRTGMIVAIVALVAISVATGGASSAALFATAEVGVAGTGTAIAAGAAGASTFSTATALSFISNAALRFAISLSLQLVQSFFISTPKARTREVTKDSGTRSQNDAFGSLVNNTTAGTPIALNYGHMRVGGQFLSGYTLSQQHAQNDAPTIAQIFNANQSPLSAEAEEAA